MPLYQNLILFFIACVFFGIGTELTSNVWLAEMWPHKAASLFQLSEFLFGFGNIMGSFTAANFVSGIEANITAEVRQANLFPLFTLTGIALFISKKMGFD